MNVILNKEACEKIAKYKEEFKAKKVKAGKWNDIISDLILKTSEKSFSNVIEKYIPDEYFIEQALNDPEAKKALMQTIRKQIKVQDNIKDEDQNGDK